MSTAAPTRTEAALTGVGVTDLSGTPTAGEVLQAHLRQQVAQVVDYEPRVRRDEPDAVHKMRVAIRRLRSALQTYRPLLDRGRTDPVAAELKWLAGVLGEARDREVLLARLEGDLDPLPPEQVLGPVRAHVRTRLSQEHRDAHEAAVEALDSDRYARLLDSLRGLVLQPPWRAGGPAGEPAVAVVPRLVRRSWRRTRRRVRAAGEAPTPEARDTALHEARKAAKRARYAAESVRPVVGRPAKRFARRMEDVQELLGEHQDAVVAQQVVRDLGVQAHLAGDNGFTYGLLVGVERCRSERARGDLEAVWRRASRRKLRRWLG